MEFYDYKTAPVVGKQVVDLHKTGMSFYDEFLTGDKQTLDYLKDNKNLQGDVVMMSPDEYFKACSEYGFIDSNVSVDSLKAGRRQDKQILDHLKKVLTVYKKRFPMPMLNKADNGQEGLHRMMVIGDMFGWDYKVPVLVVDWADKERAYSEQKRARIQKIEYNIQRSVKDALLYKFTNIDELREQIQWELDKRFEYSDDVNTPVQFELTSDEQNKEFTVTIGSAKYSFDYEDVQFIESSEEDNLDDLDLEVDDDFLVRYFGDNWREEYPHLKDKFHINENKNTKDVMTVLNNLVKEMSSFDYAFIDADGNELDDEDAMSATVQHPDQLKQLRKGVCTDLVEYTRTILDKNNIPYEVYDISCVDEDGDKPAHVFVVVNHNGKFLWVEAAWHSEAGIHKYSSLEKLFEDIARKHCVYDGHNYLSSCEIRKIKKSLVGMSQRAIYDYIDTLPITWKAIEEGINEEFRKSTIREIDDYIIQHWAYETPGEGCIFIHPNGRFVNIYPELDDHEDLCYWLEENGFGENPKDPAWFVDEFNYIRCRNSLHLCFIELPKTITRSQTYALEEWLETKVTTDYIDIEAPDGEWNKYDLDEYFPEDIIKLIKRFYSSGRLYENKSNISYKNISDIELFKEYADDILDGYGNMSDADIKSSIKEIHFEGKLVGYIGFSEYEENGNKCLGIGNFMIIERGNGFGSAVIKDVVEKYKNKYDLIYCFVDAKNDGAIRLYKKLGKVYDKEGSNDNGEYYVTFWDNGKWDLDEEFDPPYNEQQVRDNYGEETYQRLIKDPVHLWRMKTGIELIHKEPSKKELERIWANWQLMSDKQKLISDKKSIQLFGKTNAEHYAELVKTYN